MIDAREYKNLLEIAYIFSSKENVKAFLKGLEEVESKKGKEIAYKIIWTPEAPKNLSYFQVKDKSTLIKIRDLIESIRQEPKYGIGKPEKLKYQDKNIWSRRIDDKTPFSIFN